MRFLALAGRWFPGRWVRAAASALSVAVLLAVPALALAHLGAGPFSFWAAGSGAAGTSLPEGWHAEGLLPFDAPAATVSVRKAVEDDARRTLAAAKSDSAVTVVRNWQYTQNINNANLTLAAVIAAGELGAAAPLPGSPLSIAPDLFLAAPTLYRWWVFFNTGGATPTTQFSNILTIEFTYDLLVSGSVTYKRMEGIILLEYLYNQLFLQRSTATTSASPST
jgi:hypothetical protein